MRDANGRRRGFTLTDVLTVLAVLAAVVAIKPHFDDISRRGQRDSAVSQPEKATQAPALRPPAEPETLLLSRQ